ncbi:hypothetical protein IU443_28330 [Nocardia farcinica]|uniref:hypothetical protein n=1 Tax=Nocardia farcinica TaxID=37329 RepID=UPI0018963919|nr:hypothetical protein [Nocardia farcinica]MBF6393839.1 hypothetical protein [Nocardia farcinica]MBF6411300.1 hypothetical protein [Nocardia farcinica]MCZ9330276.1 hypothetical protein [Nocardia farcinica]UEX26197.1 hypothetical protein LMJ57_30060 [Nocardia farcinica]
MNTPAAHGPDARRIAAAIDRHVRRAMLAVHLAVIATVPALVPALTGGADDPAAVLLWWVGGVVVWVLAIQLADPAATGARGRALRVYVLTTAVIGAVYTLYAGYLLFDGGFGGAR